MTNLPTIRTMPTRRHNPTTRNRRRRHNPIRLIFAWATSGLFGLFVGYVILIYGFDHDPLGIRDALPKVSVEWRQAPERDR